jgi:hypothetical protein
MRSPGTARHRRPGQGLLGGGERVSTDSLSEVIRQVAIELGNGRPVPIGLRRAVLRMADLLRTEMEAFCRRLALPTPQQAISAGSEFFAEPPPPRSRPPYGTFVARPSTVDLPCTAPTTGYKTSLDPRRVTTAEPRPRTGRSRRERASRADTTGGQRHRNADRDDYAAPLASGIAASPWATDTPISHMTPLSDLRVRGPSTVHVRRMNDLDTVRDRFRTTPQP